MSYATPELIQAVRFELNDSSVPYILDDSTISYYLEKNSGSLSATSVECARAILLRLSMNASDSVVDILSIKGSTSARAYKEALILYLKSPDLNPLMKNINPYAGNISKADIESNNSNTDNNYVKNVNSEYEVKPFTDNPFVI